jgi:S-adenosylmethionine decarboxylase
LSIEFYTDRNLYDTQIVEPLLENFLYDLTATLGMTMIIDPIIKTVKDGTSACVMFAESGVQVHSWFEHKFVSVDIYSCKPYIVSDVLDAIEYWFDPTKLEIV